MNRSFLALLVLPAFMQPIPAYADTTYTDTTCFLLVEEGKSAEGNALFLSKMGIDAEAVSRVAPTRFTVGAKDFLSRVNGSFSYQADSPVLVERSGRLALYSVALKYGVGALPAALKTVTVNFKLADFARTKDTIQPATKAIQLAVAKAGMKSGLAWIVEMDMPSKGSFRAKVALAK